MNIKQLDHYGLYVSDLEATRRFYSGVLGMAEIARPASFTFPGAWFEHGHAQIHASLELEPGRVPARHHQPAATELDRGFWPHFALEVDDLEAARAELSDYQVQVVGGPHVRSDGVVQLYILDPDGYMVELFERTTGVLR
jgi:catechol 2,3-dioxygenase-like lactoylglutathione lyase family enzyme